MQTLIVAGLLIAQSHMMKIKLAEICCLVYVSNDLFGICVANPSDALRCH
jgi:hypothetical protein